MGDRVRYKQALNTGHWCRSQTSTWLCSLIRIRTLSKSETPQEIQ